MHALCATRCATLAPFHSPSIRVIRTSNTSNTSHVVYMSERFEDERSDSGDESPDEHPSIITRSRSIASRALAHMFGLFAVGGHIQPHSHMTT